MGNGEQLLMMDGQQMMQRQPAVSWDMQHMVCYEQDKDPKTFKFGSVTYKVLFAQKKYYYFIDTYFGYFILVLSMHVLGAQTFSNAAFGQGTGPIWFDSLGCNGREDKLINCATMTGSTSLDTHSEDAGLRCQAAGKHE